MRRPPIFLALLALALLNPSQADDGGLRTTTEGSDDEEQQEQQTPTMLPEDGPLRAGTGEEDESANNRPGAVHWALAAILAAVLMSGLVHVYRVLHSARLDLMTTAMRQVPDGMRPASCGACHTTQFVSAHGRVFICFCCQSANRLPREVPRPGEQQILVVPTGPLKSYEFRKGGDNYWQELSQQELPVPPPEEKKTGENGEVRKLHYRGAFCIPCKSATCLRLNEFPNEDQGAAYLAQIQDSNVVKPEVVGNQTGNAPAEANDEIMSVRSSRTNADGLCQCVVCLDKAGCMVLLPCAHGSVCEDCATRIAQNQASGGAHCPHCRSNIETLVKLHQVTGDVAHGVEVRIPIARYA